MEAQSELGTSSKYMKAKQANIIKRQNALNFFNVDLCEYLIHELLFKDTRVIKGSKLLYYKNPHRWIAEGHTKLMRDKMEFYGFKSNLARDFENPLMIMEILQPVEISIAERKIDEYTAVIRTHKIKPSPYIPIHKQWKERDF